ncbi:hypothetical protein BCF59_0546 [Mycoplasmopsis mustelae]|uniref:Uncharacterized protein n=1 Tax=Mycoplasmopsis mustelae TaxID=171289 RepID=A0A4R7UDB4_9BACT|nr:hypothetical protein [Mycoplasmopsis mustelae]TDV23555.1 hypothetical protein BCF59_0546 [Mycoplasmopsis mustelae]
MILYTETQKDITKKELDSLKGEIVTQISKLLRLTESDSKINKFNNLYLYNYLNEISNYEALSGLDLNLLKDIKNLISYIVNELSNKAAEESAYIKKLDTSSWITGIGSLIGGILTFGFETPALLGATAGLQIAKAESVKRKANYKYQEQILLNYSSLLKNEFLKIEDGSFNVDNVILKVDDFLNYVQTNITSKHKSNLINKITAFKNSLITYKNKLVSTVQTDYNYDHEYDSYYGGGY